MKLNFSILLLTLVVSSVAQNNLQFIDPGKQRVIVLTDITNEPDDQQSLVRFLVYANEFDIEGFVATTSNWLKDKVRQDKIEELIRAYGKVRGNLEKHAKGYPSEEHLLGITKSHLPLFGMEGVGIGKDSEGSEMIIRSADKPDQRPLWISVWGGANCLAQALWKVKETRTPEELKKFIAKLRVYTISDQDNAGRWIRNNFPQVFYIVSPSSVGGQEYYRATWTGISGDRHYKNGPYYKFDLVENPWLMENINKNHGPLGALYPKLDYIMEGDTPAFLGLINNGLGSAISPSYGGWGGRYVFFQSYAEEDKIWTNSLNSVDELVIDNCGTYASDQATIWRWREAFQYDFAARMDWCVVPSFNAANHNPIVSLNGNIGKGVGYAKHAEGATIRLTARGSSDPDNNKLTYRWFVYKEAGGYKGHLELQNSTAEEISFLMPELGNNQQLHIICEVSDNGTPSLFSYRRIILGH